MTKYLDACLAIARKNLKNDQDARDVVQTAFLNAVVAIRTEGYAERQSFKSWLFRIVYNEIVNFARKRKRAPGTLNVVNEPYEKLIDPLERQEKCEAVRRALSVLTPVELEFVNLHYLESRDYDDVSQIMGLKKSALYEMNRLGLKKLKQAIDPDRQ